MGWIMGDRVELTRQGEPVTLDDPRRWKKHFRSAKMHCYLSGGVSGRYWENYDLVRWAVRRTDDPFRGEGRI